MSAPRRAAAAAVGTAAAGMACLVVAVGGGWRGVLAVVGLALLAWAVVLVAEPV